MQRKRFLRLTGFSAAAILCQRTSALGLGAARAGSGPAPVSGGSGLPPVDGVQFPTGVSVWRDGRWVPLTGRLGEWSSTGLDVHLRQGETAMDVRLHAPGMPLEKLKLTWSGAVPPDVRYLGDAWERSYGDLAWSNGAVRAPWYILIYDGRQTHAIGVKTGARCFCSWSVNHGALELELDLHSGGMGVQLGDRVLEAASVVATQSHPGENPFQTDARFCGLMCASARLPEKPVYGINDWYFAYGHNSKELILSTTGTMVELAPAGDNPPFSVIDDGWEDGDVFTRANAKFGDMQQVASAIRKLGMRPGLWTRPLLANAADRPALLITRGKERFLDPTIPENLERIGATIRLYRDWGFDLVKHDYSTYDLFGRWGSQMGAALSAPGWSFSDRSLTNAEIVLQLYRTIRAAAGPMYLIGCNTVSHLSAGIFELDRIGDDTSGREWSRVVKMGVNTMAFRLPQHNAFYAVDGDCVGLTTQIPWRLNKQWMQLLAESGAPLFISAQPEATGAEQKSYIRDCFARAAAVQPTGEPLDWMANPRPTRWRLNGREVTFDWTNA